VTDLLFYNALVLTMDPSRPRAGALAVRDGRIVAVGDAALSGGGERIDCEGGVLLPAFIDAHCHLLAYAASLHSIDCSDARTIGEIQDAIRRKAASTPAGRWIRAFGYEETALAEQRHPDKRDLDAAAPEHPVRLIHRSGHATVLNSLALEEAGIGIETEETEGGSLERELSSGEPSGLILGMEQLLDGVVPPLAYEELSAAVREAVAVLLRNGITCLQDATHNNRRAEWEIFEQLIEDGALPLDIVLMEGVEYLGELPETAANGRLRRGPVKIMLHEFGDDLMPSHAELARQVAEVHAAGRQVAIHAISEGAIAAAIGAIEGALRASPRDDHRHRIEHCGLLGEGGAARLARSGIMVVSQPSFVFDRGDRYLQLVPEDRHDDLYAFRTLRDAGVALAASSDAPVTAPWPLASAATAADRKTASGAHLALDEAVTVEEALGWWTAGAASSAFLEEERGSLRPGLEADLALLPAEALATGSEGLRSLPVLRAWHRGQEIESGSF
jgi:hypothetical protein